MAPAQVVTSGRSASTRQNASPGTRTVPSISTRALRLITAFVTTHAVQALWSPERLQKIVLVGTAASRFDPAPLPPDSHERTLVLHGELDDTVPLASVLDWARPQVLPVTVVPGGEHFFHGQLPLLKSLVLRHLSAQ